ncbi:hypothetical protein OQA88_9160 [Cercophora sp. LCS_1]
MNSAVANDSDAPAIAADGNSSALAQPEAQSDTPTTTAPTATQPRLSTRDILHAELQRKHEEIEALRLQILRLETQRDAARADARLARRVTLSTARLGDDIINEMNSTIMTLHGFIDDWEALFARMETDWEGLFETLRRETDEQLREIRESNEAWERAAKTLEALSFKAGVRCGVLGMALAIFLAAVAYKYLGKHE